MKNIFFAIIFCFAFQLASAQTTFIADDGKLTYTKAEVQPEFPGGLAKFYKYLANGYKYPKERVSGKVIMQFTIDEEGNLTNIKIIRDLGFGTGEEAKRVLRKSPKWTPGLQDGKAVRVLYSLPILLQN